MHKQPYLGRIALCKRKKSLKSDEIRAFYGIATMYQIMQCWNKIILKLFC